ncbi:MAG: tol-pal system-associated acyl-CoA thioesterase [Gammaproteobacteria bacterium]|nr:tol-pal system-associated acyl-CoA thioesterase [Gammaproteobacteria bacterium]
MNSCQEFSWPVRVYYEDTDSGGVVYYANYLKFMERCRTEWLRDLGFEQDHLIEHERLIFAVRSVAVDYRKPARFNDALIVTVAVQKLGRVSIDFNQVIKRDDEILCEGQVRLASLDVETMRPKALPKVLFEKIEQLK